MTLRRLLESANQNDTVDIQRSTLSLNVAPRYVCSTWEEAVNNRGNPFDAVVIGAGMFGGYCAEKIFRFGLPKGRRVLVLDAGPFLVSTHVQNIPQIGLNVPPPMTPADDNGASRALVWGMPWRSNVDFVGQADVSSRLDRPSWPALLWRYAECPVALLALTNLTPM